jgi:hypothetical protein
MLPERGTDCIILLVVAPVGLPELVDDTVLPHEEERNMTRTRWIWLILVAIYAAFFSWYTSFGGPLADDEIAHYMALRRLATSR